MQAQGLLSPWDWTPAPPTNAARLWKRLRQRVDVVRRLRQIVRTNKERVRRTVDRWRAEQTRIDIERENATIHLQLTRSWRIARKLEKELVALTRQRPWDKDDLSG